MSNIDSIFMNDDQFRKINTDKSININGNLYSIYPDKVKIPKGTILCTNIDDAADFGENHTVTHTPIEDIVLEVAGVIKKDNNYGEQNVQTVYCVWAHDSNHIPEEGGNIIGYFYVNSKYVEVV